MSHDPVLPPDEIQDDAIIGRVFRWSLLVILLIAGVVAAFLLFSGGGAEEPVVVEKNLDEILDLQGPAAALPAVRFTDVTIQAGIEFKHANGARGDKLLPETMGGGAAFFDYDGDGDPDLLLVNSTDWPETQGRRSGRHGFFRNDGAGRFTDVSAAVGLGADVYGMGVAAADYDGDGDRDVFITAVGSNHLFRNDGGVFADVSARAGVAGGRAMWSSSAGFFDYDSDGDLDLFVCNYVNWSREIDEELNFSLNGVDRAYGPPTNYAGAHSYLYRNEGDGTFTDVSRDAGIQVDNPATGSPMGKALAVSFVDVDRDSHPDILVANDTVQNFLFRNRGDGTFEEIGARSGIGFDTAGNATGAMGLDAAHYRNDDQLAVGIGNFANEMTSLYVAQRGLQFTDEAAGEGIGSPSRKFLSFGLFFFDYDLDGRVDLLQANGHLENEIQQVQSSQSYRQPAQLFWNQGPGARSCFAEVPADSAGDLARPVVGRGATYADIDGDGDLDVLLTQAGAEPLLLRNDQQLGHHWLRARVRGAGANTDAIGAWLELEADGMRQRRQVMPTRSYLSQVELPVTFGLGAATAVDRLVVVWPDGRRREVAVDALDRVVEVTPPDGPEPAVGTTPAP